MAYKNGNYSLLILENVKIIYRWRLGWMECFLGLLCHMWHWTTIEDKTLWPASSF